MSTAKRKHVHETSFITAPVLLLLLRYIFGRPFLTRFALSCRTVVCLAFLSCLKCWCIMAKRLRGSRLNLAQIEVDTAPSKGAQPPMFDPYPLWPNGWMD